MRGVVEKLCVRGVAGLSVLVVVMVFFLKVYLAVVNDGNGW